MQHIQNSNQQAFIFPIWLKINQNQSEMGML